MKNEGLTSQGQDPATPALARDTAEELVGPKILCFSLQVIRATVKSFMSVFYQKTIVINSLFLEWKLKLWQ